MFDDDVVVLAFPVNYLASASEHHQTCLHVWAGGGQQRPVDPRQRGQRFQGHGRGERGVLCKYLLSNVLPNLQVQDKN